MTSPMQQPQAWSTIAQGFATEWNNFGAAFGEEAMRLLAPAASAHLLDVACGPGSFARVVCGRVARVTAVDFSPGMIAFAKVGAPANVDFAMMDAQALDLADGSFDAATCLFGFMFFPDRARAWRELHRVLRPGGTLVVGTWAPIDRRPMMKLGFEAAAEVFPGAPLPQKGDLQVDDECIAEATDAGFRDVTVTHFTHSVRCESGEQYVRMIEQTSIPLVMMKQRLGDTWPAARAKLAQAAERRLPPDRVLTAEALFTRAIR